MPLSVLRESALAAPLKGVWFSSVMVRSSDQLAQTMEFDKKN